MELGIGTGRPPARVHTGDCHMQASADAPSAATKPDAYSPTACGHCQPYTRLNVTDLFDGPGAQPHAAGEHCRCTPLPRN
ncbi:hypothetical protein ACWD3J_41740 [Streptomyces sp. NPDC002755]|uniref:hypothetical protein n=1 Tax=Streptomyces sp. NPDC002884 TaxID=3154544 RepID=UPI00332D9DDE